MKANKTMRPLVQVAAPVLRKNSSSTLSISNPSVDASIVHSYNWVPFAGNNAQ